MLPGKGVTDKTLAAIDLEKEPAKIKGRQLRFRKLTIEPGGVVRCACATARNATDRNPQQHLRGTL
jgi:hypothetical protein